ncbi:MAG: nitrous oxide reductase accessory protein NosL [Nitrospirota bacterium]
MKRGAFTVVLLLLATLVFAQEDVKKARSCTYCGMDREKFSHSRMLIDYDDGASVGTCSIHCAAIDLSLHIDKTPKMIGVGDYGSKKLIDAEKAFWVLGGNKPGVMTKRAKWAFEQKGAAEQFVKENGGTVVTFDEAMKAAYEDMYQDTRMIREKRKMMKMKNKEHQH